MRKTLLSVGLVCLLPLPTLAAQPALPKFVSLAPAQTWRGQPVELKFSYLPEEFSLFIGTSREGDLHLLRNVTRVGEDVVSFRLPYELPPTYGLSLFFLLETPDLACLYLPNSTTVIEGFSDGKMGNGFFVVEPNAYLQMTTWIHWAYVDEGATLAYPSTYTGSYKVVADDEATVTGPGFLAYDSKVYHEEGATIPPVEDPWGIGTAGWVAPVKKKVGYEILPPLGIGDASFVVPGQVLVAAKGSNTILPLVRIDTPALPPRTTLVGLPEGLALSPYGNSIQGKPLQAGRFEVSANTKNSEYDITGIIHVVIYDPATEPATAMEFNRGYFRPGQELRFVTNRPDALRQVQLVSSAPLAIQPLAHRAEGSTIVVGLPENLTYNPYQAMPFMLLLEYIDETLLVTGSKTIRSSQTKVGRFDQDFCIIDTAVSAGGANSGILALAPGGEILQSDLVHTYFLPGTEFRWDPSAPGAKYMDASVSAQYNMLHNTHFWLDPIIPLPRFRLVQLGIALAVGDMPVSFQDAFPSAVQEAPGTYRSTWFGLIWGREFPWIWQEELGFLYVASAGSGQNWYWSVSPDLGWIWTNGDYYPYLWSVVNGWMYAMGEGSGKVWAFQRGQAIDL